MQEFDPLIIPTIASFSLGLCGAELVIFLPVVPLTCRSWEATGNSCTLICQLQNPVYFRGNGDKAEGMETIQLIKSQRNMEVLWYVPRLTFLMPGLACSLSPAISTQLFTLVRKNKPFSKYRVSASVNELSVDHLQLLLSARSPIHANSQLLHSIILPALTRVLQLPDRHSSPLQVWASVLFFDSSKISRRQPLKFSMMLKINTVRSVGACQKLKI